MIKKILIGIVVFSGILFADSDVKPFKVDQKYFLTYDRNTSCLVRHLKVYKEPKWVAKIEVRDGKNSVLTIFNYVNHVVDSNLEFFALLLFHSTTSANLFLILFIISIQASL